MGWEFDKGCALVVGGSGGLGSAISQRLAEAGTDVMLTYKNNSSAAKKLASSLTSKHRQCAAVHLDLSDTEQTNAVIAEAEATFGAVHTVCCAAGPAIELAPIAETAPEVFRDIMVNDACGFFNLAHAAIPALRRSRGTLIALATGGLRRYPSLDILSVAPKGAVEQIIKGVAREEGRNGIRANVIGTGWVEAGLGLEVLKSERGHHLYDKLIAGTPLRRPGLPDEIADLVVFLASKSAAYISGEYIGINGAGAT